MNYVVWLTDNSTLISNYSSSCNLEGSPKHISTVYEKLKSNLHFEGMQTAPNGKKAWNEAKKSVVVLINTKSHCSGLVWYTFIWEHPQENGKC